MYILTHLKDVEGGEFRLTHWGEAVEEALHPWAILRQLAATGDEVTLSPSAITAILWQVDHDPDAEH